MNYSYFLFFLCHIPQLFLSLHFSPYFLRFLGIYLEFQVNQIQVNYRWESSSMNDALTQSLEKKKNSLPGLAQFYCFLIGPDLL